MSIDSELSTAELELADSEGIELMLVATEHMLGIDSSVERGV